MTPLSFNKFCFCCYQATIFARYCLRSSYLFFHYFYYYYCCWLCKRNLQMSCNKRRHADDSMQIYNGVGIVVTYRHVQIDFSVHASVVVGVYRPPNFRSMIKKMTSKLFVQPWLVRIPSHAPQVHCTSNTVLSRFFKSINSSIVATHKRCSSLGI